MEAALGRATVQRSVVVDLDLRRASAVQLATRARAGSDVAFQELARRLTPLMRYIVQPYYLPGGERADLRQEALFGLHKAVRDFKPEINANFDAFARLCIQRQVITAVKLANGKKHRPLSDRAVLGMPDAAGDEARPDDRVAAFLNPDSDPHDVLIARGEFEEFTRLASGSLSVMEGEVFGLWLSGLSYSQITQKTGHSHKAIDNAMARVKRKLGEGMAEAA